MEQRKTEYYAVPLNVFIKNVKALKIPVEYVKEDNGSWSCWTKPGVWGLIKARGTGATLDKAIDDYLDTSKEIADCIYQDNLPKDSDIVINDISIECFFKVIARPKKELRQCLILINKQEE
ncbi:MAG: hypothetical protein IJT58_08210 [Synergistaceae bacterium]|nr:hypothetical protein [Synergistaceae bacterium]